HRVALRSTVLPYTTLFRSLFAGPVNDFDEIVDEYHADVIENGSGSSDWQNQSIGFLKLNVDLRPRLHEIQCPTLIIQGSKDIGIDRKSTRLNSSHVSISYA